MQISQLKVVMRVSLGPELGWQLVSESPELAPARVLTRGGKSLCSPALQWPAGWGTDSVFHWFWPEKKENWLFLPGLDTSQTIGILEAHIKLLSTNIIIISSKNTKRSLLKEGFHWKRLHFFSVCSIFTENLSELMGFLLMFSSC